MTKSITLAFVLLAVAAACSAIKQSVPIVQDVDPLPAMTLASLCIETNQDVKRHKFDEDLTSLLTELGIGAPRKEGAFRGECEIWAGYDVVYAGMVPKYVQSMNVTVFQGSKRIGHIRYDASQAHGRADRHGTAKSKLRPLLKALLAATNRP